MQWIKVFTNIFANSKMQLLLKERDGDTYFRIWIQLLVIVINYISSAKTLVESIDNFFYEKLGEEKYNTYKIDCINKIYDEKFSYRLLIRLRDFSQHGHLPVYISIDNKCSFDLEQILNTPHFKHNKKIEEEMKSIVSKIKKDFGDNPRIMFTRSIAEFEICILEIYNYFIVESIDKLTDLRKKFDDLIYRRSDIIYKSKDSLNGFILYTIIDENVHCVDPKQNPMKMMEKIRDEVKKELDNVKREFEEIFRMKIIKETKR